MGGFFAVTSKEDCVFDLFFGTDYHSHLGTRRGGMAVYGKNGFDRAIHNIENSPFRTKFEKDVNEMEGNFGIGCISDYEPQPLIVRSHHGTFAITTVGKINNTDAIVAEIFKAGNTHFLEMSGGDINATELVAAIINQRDNIVEGIKYAQELIDGSMSIMILTPKGVYLARDKVGRTPIAIGKKEGAFCAAFEAFAYLNLGYTDYKELGPGEIVVMTPECVTTLAEAGKDMKICAFLWVYYGYPSSSYEEISVEKMHDLIVNPEVKDTFVKRSKILKEIRAYLDDKGFLEVETPILTPFEIGAAARPFYTHHNTLDLDMVLRIETELYLKRLIVGGIDRDRKSVV